MEKPSVTIKHSGYYLIGGYLLVLSLLPLLIVGTRPEEEKWMGWLAVGLCLAAALGMLLWGATVDTIDERGISRTSMFGHRCWAWSEIAEIGVARVPDHKSINSFHPEICITAKGGWLRRIAGKQWKIRNLRTGLTLEYEKKTWDCIRHYYGTPDFDEWGKPPTVS